MSNPFDGRPFDATPFGDTGDSGGPVTLSATASATCALTGAGAGSQTGVFAVATCALTGAAYGGAMGQVATLPITIDVPKAVSVGLPIRIDVYVAKTGISLPISLGRYAVTATLPITIDVYQAVAPTLPITIWGSQTTAVTDPVVIWRPKIMLNGVDISAKAIGAIDVEFDEGAAPVASFTYVPADGVVDPLLAVGKTVTLSYQRLVSGSVTQQAPIFTGIVSDPEWDAAERLIAISATGDLQSKLDRMDKTAIRATVGGSYSEWIFGPEADLSGWEFAEALLSTQPSVIWQDRAGAIRVTACAAKASPDYTFDASDILERAQVVRFGGRMDIVNRVYLTLQYRHEALRQRNVTFSFAPVELQTPSTYLSGNLGGWLLPQRTQIESAANGSGWTVIGDITYTDIWPSAYYSTYSDQGIPMMSGFTVTDAVAAELCIGARWTAAKRWKQSWTESYEFVVEATDSISAVGVLATEESYAIEDPATDDAWESDDAITGYKTGSTVMSNGVDRVYRLDTIRADVAAAQAVALAKAQAEVLKSHRETTVSITTPFDPRLDLSNTVKVDTAYLECQGKIRRIRHHLDIETGDATTEIDIALSRHNGSGLVVGDPLTPPSAPGDPTETAPSRYHRLEMHIGGQTTQPDWDPDWDGYVVNLPFDSSYGSATLRGSWDRNPANPQMANRLYEEGFHIVGPDIASSYADPVDFADAQTYDVAIPEDLLLLTSG